MTSKRKANVATAEEPIGKRAAATATRATKATAMARVTTTNVHALFPADIDSRIAATQRCIQSRVISTRIAMLFQNYANKSGVEVMTELGHELAEDATREQPLVDLSCKLAVRSTC